MQQVEQQLNMLNPGQLQAALHKEGPALVLACPGSGKTTTMIIRLASLIAQHQVKASRCLAISFSRAAAGQLEDTFIRRFPDFERPVFSTIHRLAYQMTRDYLQRIGTQYTLIEGREAKPSKQSFISKAFEQVMQEQPTEEEIQEVELTITLLKNRLIPKEEWSLFEGNLDQVGEIALVYDQLKFSDRSHIFIDFDDMLVFAEHALRTQPNFRKQYAAPYDYVCTDEAQDTSLVQFKIIEWLVKEHQNIYIVADDDQSIYMWRGANPSYLMQFHQQYPEAKTYYLETNYRSTPNIIKQANQLIAHNHQRYPKKMSAHHEEEGTIHIKKYATEQAQTDDILNEILAQEQFEETAILFRNNHSAVPMMLACFHRGIPFQMKEVDVSFFNHWIMKDMYAFFDLIIDSSNDKAFARIALKLNQYLSRKQLNAFERSTLEAPSILKFIQANELFDKQKDFLRSMEAKLMGLKEGTVQRAVEVIRFELGYDEAIKSRAKLFGYHEESMFQLLDQIMNIAKQVTTFEAFKETVEQLKLSVKESAQAKEGVTLSTIHSAKGLEWCHVYLIDIQSGILPSDEDLERRELVEEARRVFYVGVTRAKQNLTISYHEEKKGTMSPFTKEFRGDAGVTTATASPQRVKAKGRQKVEQTLDTSELQVGRKVTHHVFGEGEIQALADEIITIQFGTQCKKFDVSTILQYGLVELIK